jgi:ribosomal protein S18 acetylase RimI-like enzyme
MAAEAKPLAVGDGAVRRATVLDVPALTPMLVRAFTDDPVAVWACRSQALRLKMLRGMYVSRLKQMLSYREVWATQDLSSAALWAPPGHWQTSFLQDATIVRHFLHPLLLARLPMLAVGLSGVHRIHPESPPHWYLSLLGTDPDLQGRGLGSAVLQPVLDRCDLDGVGAYLESSKVRNLGFYERYGFRIVGELQLPWGGPKMWPMWRDPGAS